MLKLFFWAKISKYRQNRAAKRPFFGGKGAVNVNF